MKKILTIVLSLVFLLTGLEGCANRETKSAGSSALSSPETSKMATESAKERSPELYCSTCFLANFTREILGDHGQVHVLIEGDPDAHHWEPSSGLMVDLSKSQGLIYSGAGLEAWLDKLKENLPETVKLLDSSKGVDLIKTTETEEADHDHDHEDEKAESREDKDHDHEDEHAHHHHGQYDPHIWLSPKNARIQSRNIANYLMELDPAHKEDYTKNLEKLDKKLEALDEKYTKELAPFSGKTIVVPHQAFGYLCRDYALKQVSIQGLLADGQPDAKKLAEIVDQAKKDGRKAIFRDAYGDDAMSKSLAEEIGGKVYPLYTLESISPEDQKAGADYFLLMEKNLESLKAGLQE